MQMLSFGMLPSEGIRAATGEICKCTRNNNMQIVFQRIALMESLQPFECLFQCRRIILGTQK